MAPSARAAEPIVTPSGVVVTPPGAASSAPAAPSASAALSASAAPSASAASSAPAAPSTSLATGGVPITPVLPANAPIAPAPSDLPPPLRWKWSSFSNTDYVIGATGGAITLTAAIVPPLAKHSLSGGLWFDNAVRNALRAHSVTTRYEFRDASDVGLSLSVMWPFVADALTEAWWYRGSRETASQMALIDLETLAISGAIQGVTNTLVSRERPYGRNCGTPDNPSDSIDCADAGHYRSFFSGHATFSFTGAALICVHHFENELLGSPWDTLSCVGGYAVAATTSTFRIVSDMHYASDVLTGALVGTLVGYGVPLLHYRNKGNAGTSATGGLELHLIPEAGGIGVLGIF